MGMGMGAGKTFKGVNEKKVQARDRPDPKD